MPAFPQSLDIQLAGSLRVEGRGSRVERCFGGSPRLYNCILTQTAWRGFHGSGTMLPEAAGAAAGVDSVHGKSARGSWAPQGLCNLGKLLRNRRVKSGTAADSRTAFCRRESWDLRRSTASARRCAECARLGPRRWIAARIEMASIPRLCMCVARKGSTRPAASPKQH